MDFSAPLLALAGYAFVTSITPGPNNLMLLASGTTFGVRRSLPHLAGISAGFGVMLWAVGTGLAETFARHPQAHAVLRWVSVAYLLYLAWKTATAAPPEGETASDSRPLGFMGAAVFQAVNPKAWAMALTAVTAFGPGLDGGLSVASLVAVFVLVNLPCCGAWLLLGKQMRRFLHQPRALRLFNGAAAALMLLSVLPLLKG